MCVCLTDFRFCSFKWEKYVSKEKVFWTRIRIILCEHSKIKTRKIKEQQSHWCTQGLDRASSRGESMMRTSTWKNHSFLAHHSKQVERARSKVVF